MPWCGDALRDLGWVGEGPRDLCWYADFEIGGLCSGGCPVIIIFTLIPCLHGGNEGLGF